MVLASESPRRAELLRRAGIPFTVRPACVAELSGGAAPRELAVKNAACKAECVAAQFPDELVLGADTVVALDGRIYGKPRDPAEAAAMLRTLSGRTHEVVTGMALRRTADGVRIDFAETTRVTFRVLTDGIIRRYLALVPVLDKAGAYALQDHGGLLISAVEGDPDNVVGLPVAALKIRLEKIPNRTALTKIPMEKFLMHREKDRIGKWNVATRRVTTENAPVRDFREAQKEPARLLAVSSNRFGNRK